MKLQNFMIMLWRITKATSTQYAKDIGEKNLQICNFGEIVPVLSADSLKCCKLYIFFFFFFWNVPAKKQ